MAILGLARGNEELIVRVSKNFSFCLCFASGPLVDRLQGGVF